MSERADYAGIQAVNWSSLKNMDTARGGSPRMYRHRLANPSPSKPAYRLGNAAHCAVLEPEKFEPRYVVLTSDEIDEIAPARNSKAGKALIADHPEWATDAMASDAYKAAACAAAYPGREMITADEHADAMAMRDAVHDHPVARELLRGGLSEEVLTWTDPDTGLACKGRADYLRPDLLLDLKSTKDPSPQRFERDAVNYGYFGQAMFYHDGATVGRRLDGKIAPHIICIRNCDDYDVAVYRLDSSAIETGRAVYRALLRKLQQCIDADYWPGVAPELKFLAAPPWAMPAEESTDEESF